MAGQGKSDGRKPKFRLLCKACNSYMHTIATIGVNPHGKPWVNFLCRQCCNDAASLDEEIE